MPILEAVELSGGGMMLDVTQAAAAGVALNSVYRTAEPFPHIVLDDFIDPDFLRPLLTEWPKSGERASYDRHQERLKFEWQPKNISTPVLRAFLAEMVSESMVRFLEGLTGIPNLITDPYFVGGGLHETRSGGHLGIHADFNIHKQMNLIRRINLLIYLNDDWQPEWNGALELWSKDMQHCVISAMPTMGRAVIFNTDLDSFHGVPTPLACPPNQARRSVALYYYTSEASGTDFIPDRTTNFQRRPNSKDRTDWKVLRRHILADWVPPIVLRAIRRKT